ncbi:MAG: hypothetical protein KF873_19525 [Gemmataceae bacterium]|nr:hypothetical protein [Gemmataceae bacterium]
MKRTAYAVLLALIGFGLVGCGEGKKTNGPTEHSQSDVLLEVAGLIRNYSAAKGKGPQKIADLAPYETEFQRGFAAVKSGEVVVLWGGTVAGEGGGSASKTIVAHEKDVPTAGGHVALESGEVVKVSAGEFAAAPKPGKK